MLLDRLRGNKAQPQESGTSRPEETGTAAHLERDNRGTRQDTLDQAVAYWRTRMTSPKKDPFVMYVFDRPEDARAGLLELPCIEIAEDTDDLICTEVLIFGYWAQDDGTYEAVLCGGDLSHDLWQAAHDSFARNGGRLKNDLEPEPDASQPQPAADASASKVRFVREDRQPNRIGAMCVYRIHEAPDAASAQAFLTNTPVTESLVYLVVETPEGNYCRDIEGMYKE